MDLERNILRLPAMVFLIGCIIYTAINYRGLSSGEGWGIVFMVGVFIFGASAFIVDLVIQNIVRSSKYKVLIRSLVLVTYVILFFLGT